MHNQHNQVNNQTNQNVFNIHQTGLNIGRHGGARPPCLPMLVCMGCILYTFLSFQYSFITFIIYLQSNEQCWIQEIFNFSQCSVPTHSTKRGHGLGCLSTLDSTNGCDVLAMNGNIINMTHPHFLYQSPF